MFETKSGETVDETIRRLRASGLYEYVERDYVRHRLAVPNDPRAFSASFVAHSFVCFPVTLLEPCTLFASKRILRRPMSPNLSRRPGKNFSTTPWPTGADGCASVTTTGIAQRTSTALLPS